MAVDLQPYKIDIDDKNYPTKHNDALDHMESEINSGLDQITANLDTLSSQITSEIDEATGALSLQIAGELDAAVAVVEDYRDQAAVSATTATTQAGIATTKANETVATASLAEGYKNSALNSALAVSEIVASLGDVAARVMPMLKRRSLDTVTAIKFKAAEGWEKVGNHTWMNEERPSGRMLGEFASAAAAWASTVDGVAAASGDYYWDTGVNAQLELTTPGNTQFAHRFGSRHFPLEALFVLCDSTGSKELLIFDLTHPLMPVWKRAIVSGSGQWRRFMPYAVFTSMDYQDGVLVLGSNNTINSGAINASYVRGVAIADFKNDRAIHYKERDGYGQSKSNVWQKGLADWNDSYFMPNSSGDNSTGGFLQSYTPNVSFLPGGHITAAAGAGFTVINPDLDSAVKANSTTHWEAAVELNGRLYSIYDTAVGSGWLVNFGLTDSLTASFTADNSWTPGTTPALSGRLPVALVAGDDSLLFSSTSDLQQLWPNPSDPDSSLYAHRGLNYATPPMKKPELMLICGSDEGTFSDSEDYYTTSNAINGSATLLTDIGNSGATIAGESTLTNGNTAALRVEPAVASGRAWIDLGSAIATAGLAAGDAVTVRLSAMASSSEGDMQMFIGSTNGGGALTPIQAVPADDTYDDYELTFTVNGTANYLVMREGNASDNGIGYFTGLALGRAITDRSGKGKNSAIDGSLTAAALTVGGVAGFSGYTSGNRIIADNPWQGIGTDSGYLALAFVCDPASSSEFMFHISYHDGTEYRDSGVSVYLRGDVSGVINVTFTTVDGFASSAQVQTSVGYEDGLLHTLIVEKTSTHYRISIDEETVGAVSVGSHGNLVFNALAKLHIGTTGSLSGTAPNTTIWFAGGGQTTLTRIERNLIHRGMRNRIEGKAALDEAPSKLAYDPIRKAFEMVGDTYRQTLQDGAITASSEHESGDSPQIAVGSRSEIAIGGGTGAGSLLTDIPERNLREKTLTLVPERKTVTYEGDATGSRVLFPDPTDDAEVAEVVGWRPVLVYDDGVEQTKGAADDYTIADYGLGRYCVDFATEPADGNNVDIVFEREVWK